MIKHINYSFYVLIFIIFVLLLVFEKHEAYILMGYMLLTHPLLMISNIIILWQISRVLEKNYPDFYTSNKSHKMGFIDGLSLLDIEKDLNLTPNQLRKIKIFKTTIKWFFLNFAVIIFFVIVMFYS